MHLKCSSSKLHYLVIYMGDMKKFFPIINIDGNDFTIKITTVLVVLNQTAWPSTDKQTLQNYNINALDNDFIKKIHLKGFYS